MFFYRNKWGSGFLLGSQNLMSLLILRADDFLPFQKGIDAICPEMTNHTDVFFHSCLTRLCFFVVCFD